MAPDVVPFSEYQYGLYTRAKLYCTNCIAHGFFSPHCPLRNRQRKPPTGPVLEYFWMGIFASSNWSPAAICECRKSPPLIRRDLVDSVAHAYRRFLVGLGLEMGLPTTWKGDGRVTARKLTVIWEPLKCSLPMNTVFCTGC